MGSAPAFGAALLPPAALVAAAAVSAATGRPVLPRTVPEAAARLAAAYPAGSARVTARGRDAAREAAGPPRDVAVLLEGLAARNAHALGNRQGEVDVTVITARGPDGGRRSAYVVTIPGTKDWQVDPRSRPHLNDLATNAGALGGTPGARIEGLATALERAGARRGDPVMLVGHSQGGMLAVRAADQWTRSGRFTVTHAVTAGSPVGAMPVPESVRVLSLENRHDVIARLDAAPNADRVNQTTVEFDADFSDVSANHALDATYLPAARLLGAPPYRDDPSVAEWVDSAAPFLAAGADAGVSVEVYDIRNGDVPSPRAGE